MNRKRRAKQLRKFINRYGTIAYEYKRPPIKSYAPYRKGSYVASFESDKLDLYCLVGGVNKYLVYKGIVNSIKLSEISNN